jgi:branched-chain amino acid transport system substrate-binding protein
LPAGDAAKGYISATFHAPGKGFKVHEDLKKFVYDKNKGSASWDKVGEVLYNRGLVNAMITAEAVREAVKKHGAKVTGEQTREGMENLNLTQDRLDKLGFGQMMKPIKVTCSDHEGNGPVVFQQWDGKEWKLVSDWVEPMRDVVRPMVEESAKKFADENKITPRQCPSS